ncbi:MAG: ATP-binding cassette domain-containing protein, partial [Pseudomonadota bacterium]
MASLINIDGPKSVLKQSPTTAIRLENLQLTLGQDASRVHVLKGIDLNIETGTSTGIVGPSGSGKSTLLMVIAGLERIDDGKIFINETDITGMSEDKLAAFRGRNIGIVFQSFHLIPNMTAVENVAVPLELNGAPNALERASDELRAVGLGDRLDHYPGQLSGGEQQRVALARALSPSPAVLIAVRTANPLPVDRFHHPGCRSVHRQSELPEMVKVRGPVRPV